MSVCIIIYNAFNQSVTSVYSTWSLHLEQLINFQKLDDILYDS